MSNSKVVNEDIRSIVNLMNEEGQTSIEVSVQYRVIYDPITLGLHELSCADEMTISEFVIRKVEEENTYASNISILDASDVEELDIGEFDEVGDLVRHLENEVKEPNISITVQYTTETVVELSLQTLNEWKNNSLPDTMTDVLKSEIKGCYYVEEWEVL
jgi:hypothetical protein